MRYITIETAPNEIMPHSIYSFLQMVEAKTWDDTKVVGTHSIMMATADPIQNKRERPVSKTLIFPEYTDEYPHLKHTVGFGGRPGGPEFYINLDDNRDHHGPGGQDHHDLAEEADPCFGKVVHGFEILPKLKDYNPIVIKSMKLVSN